MLGGRVSVSGVGGTGAAGDASQARKGGGGRGHRYGTRVRCVKTGDSEPEVGGVSMQWADLLAGATHLVSNLHFNTLRSLCKKAQR